MKIEFCLSIRLFACISSTPYSMHTLEARACMRACVRACPINKDTVGREKRWVVNVTLV